MGSKNTDMSNQRCQNRYLLLEDSAQHAVFKRVKSKHWSLTSYNNKYYITLTCYGPELAAGS